MKMSKFLGFRPHVGGYSQTTEYYAWKDMLRRCYDPDHRKYPRYGARGISVCERWKQSFPEFLNDVGLRPSVGLSLDRIDNDKQYDPSNVRWADSFQQNRNTSWNVRIHIDGESLSIAEWSERSGVAYPTIWQRLRRGVTGRDLLSKGKLFA